MRNPNLPQEGRCRCGQIRFRVSVRPLFTSACHCTGCQRMSSSAYSLTAAVPAAAFEVIQGQPVLGGLHGETRHFFCPHCMSWMFTRPAGFDAFVNVRPTMIDAGAWSEPYLETFTRERLPGVTTAAVKSFETFPPPDQFDRLLAGYAEWAEG